MVNPLFRLGHFSIAEGKHPKLWMTTPHEFPKAIRTPSGPGMEDSIDLWIARVTYPTIR